VSVVHRYTQANITKLRWPKKCYKFRERFENESKECLSHQIDLAHFVAYKYVCNDKNQQIPIAGIANILQKRQGDIRSMQIVLMPSSFNT